MKRPVNKISPYLPIFLLCVFATLYFDIAGMATPWLTGGFAAAVFGYLILFGFGGHLLFITICLGMSLVSLKLQARVKHQR